MPQSIRDEILAVLLDRQPNYLSGEELSHQVGVSRAAIWKHMEELRAGGYEIEAKPRSGYRLVYRPDRVAPEEIYPHLQTNRFGREIQYQNQTPSTQLIAHQWAKEDAQEGAIVVAEEQVDGKGRLGRVWHSPPRTGIWMSLILRPPIALQNAYHLTILTSVGIKRGIERVTGLDIQIKWPNDLLIDGKKVCGVLTEIRGEQDRIHYAIIGIGMNVNTKKQDFPKEILDIATSLSIELGGDIHRATLISAILAELEECYERYLKEGFQAIQQEWERGAYKMDQMITVRTPQGDHTGILKGLYDTGALKLQVDQGTIAVYSAEIDIEKY
ncbi:BirA family transcriptional regulator, biotin operon repressor / biotin-[acetyl-CoA-carboxylase] ligase [Thermoactinomyces sp. DSM 45891]|uniref:biotin--[acetyl-CoA-carboxylase] ligase n=1 Tax=Thermoactinomyces sp. DSM 45891 TaxID=1761907 RepID=UPI000917580F|nr:biotin--[acetyl-CoA-carboxylase] ligase [Thermoactinomyces sp. DSM 45891]SFW99916.1 BirA family transcriptional regulator, biotin operon repressor / biotin-[acetyl-CoA-carboxylase] ligase [Thermoactinomyces sp. DSM 45891]